MPIERRVILSLQPAEHARFQHALLEAGLVDQLVQPIAPDAPIHALLIPSEDALFKLQAAMTLHGLSTPGVRRYWKPTSRELTAFDLLVMDIWLHGGSESAIVQTITMGRNSEMPAHKDFLGEAKSHLLAAYVYSLSLEPGEPAARKAFGREPTGKK